MARNTVVPPDIERVRAAIGDLTEPETGFSLTELGLVGSVTSSSPEGVRVEVQALTSDERACALLHYAVRDAACAVDNVHTATVDVTPMDAAARSELGHNLRSRRVKPGTLGCATSIYAVASGKGGVGKSTTTANLATALAAAGKKVGVLDADVWGYSLPQLFGTRRAPIALRGLMLPVAAHGVRLMSIGFFVDDEQPVVWRGPMLHKAIEQFLGDVYWGELDVLLVDLPPGTGDVTLSVLAELPDAALLVVTTPQRAAEQVAARVGRMALDAGVPIAGVVENMTETGDGPAIFGAGGGAALAGTIGAPLLASIPLSAEVCLAGDTGVPIVASAPDSPAARELAELAGTLPVVRRGMAGRALPLFVS